jgi:hypothetical protein
MGAITAEVVDTGEKRDGRGRRVLPRSQRLALIEAFRASGMSMAAFARREGSIQRGHAVPFTLRGYDPKGSCCTFYLEGRGENVRLREWLAR